MSDAVATLVDHVLAVEWARLPPDAQVAARAFLYDTICVGIAGRNAANADRIAAAAGGWSGAGTCGVLGRPGIGLTAPYAAFANAFQIHAQEYDCVHEPAVAHPLATVVATLLAAPPASGEDFLAAMVAGVDVVATLGVAVTTPLRFFRPATAGIFGSVCALARLRRLDRATAIAALGHALSFVSGTMQAHVEGKPTLAIQVAAAARSAVEAVDLALAGIDAPLGSIDGPFGYLSLFEGGYDLAGPLASLGKQWRITELSWKPFPTGRAAHGAIVAMQVMIGDGLSAATLDRFVYRAPPLIARLVGRRPVAGMGIAYARLCFAYLGAVTLTRGTVGLGDFEAGSLADPALLALAERIVVEADDNPDPAAFVPAHAVATRRDGTTLSVEVTRQFGSPPWPLTRDEQRAKGRACLAFAGMDGDEAVLATILDGFEWAPDAHAALAPAFGEHRPRCGHGSASAAVHHGAATQ